MRLNELQKKITKAIRTTLSHRDLCNLCTFNDIQSSGLKRIIQDRLESFIQNQPYNQLLAINNKIEEYTKRPSATPQSSEPPASYVPDTLSASLVSQAPIDLSQELSAINRQSVVIVHFTEYSQTHTAVPTHASPSLNNTHNVRLPNMLPNVPTPPSPFYCAPVALHPLSILIPLQMPNVSSQSNSRVTSHSSLQFSLSEDAAKLIVKNSRKNGTKLDYKWQVLLRFVALDPTLALPTPTNNNLTKETIPPYLTVGVNGESVTLWDILPSNCKQKEGKRHPKAVNITDKVNLTSLSKTGSSHNSSGSCYKQTLAVSWWQCPGVFQYYYVGVYLERKLSVRELLDLFVKDTHINIQPMESTLSLIKSKLNDAKYVNDDDDDDLVVSNVLPISLSCPVGRSRIEVPLRTLNCQHLQCFDAYLFLSMNERRSIWKCPICDISATPKELFCDKFFQKILQQYKDNEDINDVNVNADGTYVAVHRRRDDASRVQPVASKTTESVAQGASATGGVSGTLAQAENDTMIVLDSDDESDDKVKSPVKTVNNNNTKNNNQKSIKSVEKEKIDKSKQSKIVEQSSSATQKSKSNNNSTKSSTSSTANNSMLSFLTPLSKTTTTTSSSSSLSSAVSSSTTVTPSIVPSLFSQRTLPPPLHTPPQAVPSPSVIQSTTCFPLPGQPRLPIAAATSSSSSVAAAPQQSQIDRLFQISSLMQSSAPHGNRPIASSIIAPIAAPLIAPIISISTNNTNTPIPAPIVTPLATPIASFSSNTVTNSTIVTPIAAPLASPIATFPVNQTNSPIRAPVQTSVRSALQAAIAAPFQTPLSAAAPSSSPRTTTATTTPIRAPISACSFESLLRLNPSSTSSSSTNNNNNTNSLQKPNKNPLNIDRTLNDVVKTLPTNVVFPAVPPIKTKNIIAHPISCPAVILNEQSQPTIVQPEVAVVPAPRSPSPLPTVVSRSEETVVCKTNKSFEEVSNRNLKETPLGKTKENIKEIVSQAAAQAFVSQQNDCVPPIQKVSAPASITIPSVSIDLTSDDEDEEATPTPAAPSASSARPSNPLNAGIKWRSIHDPRFSGHIMNTGNSSSSNAYRGRPLPPTALSANSFSHFKTHQVNTNTIGGKRSTTPYSKQPIDLTEDDDDEEEDSVKKARFDNNIGGARFVNVQPN